MKLFVRFLIIISLPLFFPLQSAQAHAHLVNSTPSSGEVLSALPTQIILTFDGPLININGSSANEIIVKDENGKEIQEGAAKANGVLISVGLTSKPVAGSISVYWRAVAEDGHPEEGSYTFSSSSPSAAGEVRRLAIPKEPTKPNSNIFFLLLIIPIILPVIFFYRRKLVR